MAIVEAHPMKEEAAAEMIAELETWWRRVDASTAMSEAIERWSALSWEEVAVVATEATEAKAAQDPAQAADTRGATREADLETAETTPWANHHPDHPEVGNIANLLSEFQIKQINVIQINN